MGAADVDAVRRGYEAFNRRDVDTVLSLLDPGIVFRMAMDPMGVHPPFRGLDGVRELFETLWESFDEFRAELGEVTDMGDVVVASGRMVARRSGETDETDFKFSHFWRVREGQAVAVAFHDTTNPLALLEDQLGSRLRPRSTRD
jgi:ketosteroid isomerase-like protein